MLDFIEKEFEYDTIDGWGGLCSQIIAWVNFYCPYCKKYHSNSFLFDLEKDKTEYIGICFYCNGRLKIKIPLELNNKLYKTQDEYIKKLERGGNQGLEKWLSKD
jgi:hypothetical protein